ncbi:hypothetical protein [Brochothrix thermosphacta]|uniref:N-acetyltransferase domain-containing protein n=1 Tax=Brochothrix thermosphacta TaxID=2756 RepID=A0A2X0QGU5_BROTH|nr:hypothetical protein [Brochothrix thermosphacta]SPP27819.1 hypothetical protein BTBSAS_190002 [Brochothrix thermosphacta]
MTIKMKPAIRKDDAIIISIWEASVRETHDFLLPGDFEEFKIQLIKYLPLLDMQLWLDDDVPIGFSAIANQKLEMFFIAPPYIGQGYGRSIMAHLFSDFQWMLMNKMLLQLDFILNNTLKSFRETKEMTVVNHILFYI